MRQCNVYCVNTEKDALADILEETDKRLKVALVGTQLTLVMTRSVTVHPYTCTEHGMEFETFGDLG